MERKDTSKMTIRELWNYYFENIGTGEDVEYFNNLLNNIEQLLPFESVEEHNKWLDMMATWNGEPELEEFMEELLKRTELKEIAYSMENKTTLWKAKKIIEERNETLGNLLERSMINGSIIEDSYWDEIPLDPSNYKDLAREISEDDTICNPDEIESELHEVRNQIIEIAKMLGISFGSNN